MPRPVKGTVTRPSKDELQALYFEHTDLEIGKRYGVSDASVSQWRRQHDIPTMTPRQRAQQSRSGPTLDDLTPAKLIDAYACMGDSAIAALYGVSKPTIRNLRRRWGIASVSKTERCTSHLELSNEQKEVILGVALGDGHLLRRGVLKVTHYYRQLDYLRHLHESLMPLSRPLGYEEKEGLNQSYAFVLRTSPHVWVKSLQGLLYPDGNRCFPSPVLAELTPRSLAHWYFDDGHLDGGLPSLALGDLNLHAAERVAYDLGQRFSLDTYLKTGAPSCRVVGIRARSADAFFFLIREFATSDMLYKLPKRHWPHDKAPHRPAYTKSDTPLTTSLIKRSKEWIRLTSEDQEALLDDLVDFWGNHGFPYPSPRPEDIYVLSNLDSSHVLVKDHLRARQVGQTVCQSFMPHMWSAHSHNSPSPRKLFDDASSLRKALRICLENDRVPTASGLRGCLRYLRRSGVYNFRPSAAKALIDRFCPVGGLVFDPCAGYGGRLLGALVSGARAHYIACEPCSDTYAALNSLKSWVEDYLPGASERVSVHCIPAEDYDFPKEVDLVLTSPPYWKREVYSNEETQSSSRYPDYLVWLNSFWGTVLRKASESLKTGGWLLLNVDDFQINGKEYPLVQDTIDLMIQMGYSEPTRLHYDMPLSGGEEVLCWSKGVGATMQDPDPQTNLTLCRSCGSVVGASLLEDGLCRPCSKPKGIKTLCGGCGVAFLAQRKNQRFHDSNCAARHRRSLKKKAPAPRKFTCCDCGAQWSTEKKGNFRWCPSCREKRDLQGRTKVCQYRNCGETFLDTSLKKSSKYCCVQHRDKEKRLRLGS